MILKILKKYLHAKIRYSMHALAYRKIHFFYQNICILGKMFISLRPKVEYYGVIFEILTPLSFC